MHFTEILLYLSQNNGEFLFLLGTILQPYEGGCDSKLAPDQTKENIIERVIDRNKF